MTVDSSTHPKILRAGQTLSRVRGEVGRAVVGQQQMIDRLLIGLLTGGHVLLEGVPGLAKTLAVKSLADSLSLTFRRIQFTPDLLPADLTGTLIYNPRDGSFAAKRGPLFAHLVLADEINRAPAKVQSALLEAMEERQVTVAGKRYKLPDLFMVLATQNPIEQEGTYPLAEAQVDRFMMKLKVTYPSRQEEAEILDRMLVARELKAAPVLERERLLGLREVVDAVYLDAKIKTYILDLVIATRDPRSAGLPDLSDLISFGASPRATLFLARAAKAMAMVRGRGYVIPEDVKELAPDVLRHRIIPTYEAEAEEITTDALITRLLDRIPVP